MERNMKRRNYVLDRKPKKVWNLNQLNVSETFVGVPTAEYYKNNKGNQFIKLMLDAGYSTLHLYFLIFDFPMQKILNKKFHNSFELVRYFRECNGIPVDDGISQLHDINFQEILDWLNQEEVMKIKVVSKDMNGFKRIIFVDDWVHFKNLEEVDEYLEE